MEERRKSPRIAFQFFVRFCAQDEQFRCPTIDASEGGLFVESRVHPEIDSVMPFVIEHHELPAALDIVGRVAHCKDDPPGFGLQITQVQNEEAFEVYCDLLARTASGKTRKP
jgi:hypothetical protein